MLRPVKYLRKLKGAKRGLGGCFVILRRVKKFEKMKAELRKVSNRCDGWFVTLKLVKKTSENYKEAKIGSVEGL